MGFALFTLSQEKNKKKEEKAETLFRVEEPCRNDVNVFPPVISCLSVPCKRRVRKSATSMHILSCQGVNRAYDLMIFALLNATAAQMRLLFQSTG